MLFECCEERARTHCVRLYSVIFARFVCLRCSALAAHKVCITKIHSVDCVKQSEFGAVVCHIVSVVVRPPRVIDTHLNRPFFVRHLLVQSVANVQAVFICGTFLSAFIYFVRSFILCVWTMLFAAGILIAWKLVQSFIEPIINYGLCIRLVISLNQISSRKINHLHVHFVVSKSASTHNRSVRFDCNSFVKHRDFYRSQCEFRWNCLQNHR